MQKISADLLYLYFMQFVQWELDANVVLPNDSFMSSLLLYLSLLTQFLTSIQFDKC